MIKLGKISTNRYRVYKKSPVEQQIGYLERKNEKHELEFVSKSIKLDAKTLRRILELMQSLK